eukprot:m.1105284 g.1105284  ORF g.1105284 m.1105284 type:complete len:243 (-) comp24337_c0_seq2:4128-4856(-)
MEVETEPETVFEPHVVLPGDKIELPSDGEVILGPGLLARHIGEDDEVTTTKCGILRAKKANRAFWVDSTQRRATPAKGDEVIGIVVGRPMDVFSVDIGSSRPASLPVLAFEGATKRNKPNVQIGDLVFARVVTAGKHIEAELSCMNANGKSGGFGQIIGGYMFSCSSGLCRSLRRPNSPILTALSSSVAFEIVVGLNGRVWVNAETPEHVVLVANAVENSEHMTPKVASAFVEKLSLKLSNR